MIQVLSKDRNGCTVADVVLPDGTNVSRELLRAGLAWWYRQYSKDVSLGALEQEAQQAKRGLWADPNTIPPWEIRHSKQGRTPSAPGRLSSDPREKPDTTPIAIIGNRNSQVYHRPDCPNYTATAPKNRVIFNSEAEAEAAGYPGRGIAREGKPVPRESKRDISFLHKVEVLQTTKLLYTVQPCATMDLRLSRCGLPDCDCGVFHQGRAAQTACGMNPSQRCRENERCWSV